MRGGSRDEGVWDEIVSRFLMFYTSALEWALVAVKAPANGDSPLLHELRRSDEAGNDEYA